MIYFNGYKRPDGKVGIRNKVLILPTSICATDTARIIASKVEGTVLFHNQNGCSQVPKDQKLTMDIMAGMAANPNVYGILVLSLGCENCQNKIVVDEIRKLTNKPIETLIIQECGGVNNTIEKGITIANELICNSKKCKREKFPISELIIGTECGSSDPTSGLASNPLVGKISDYFVDNNATVILSETTEFLGAEHILARRGATPEIQEKIIKIVKDNEKYFTMFGENIRVGNPSPGNIAGGISTLEEKSLGCIHKGGSRQINNVYEYAQQIKNNEGLVIMDTPGNDASSVAAMIAGGAQIVLFTTGKGTPTGSPIAPVIKITANKNTFETMNDCIDFDASEIIDNNIITDEIVDRLINVVVDVANGKQTKSEELGYFEMAIARLCNFA